MSCISVRGTACSDKVDLRPKSFTSLYSGELFFLAAGYVRTHQSKSLAYVHHLLRYPWMGYEGKIELERDVLCRPAIPHLL